MINWRSRLSGIATGDQAMFVTRAAFETVGGFPDLPLMEDVALSRKLKQLGPPFGIATPAVTSGRRWEYHGVFRTIFLMWRLRLAYYLGVAPAYLAVALPRCANVTRAERPRPIAPAPSVCAACQSQCGSSRKARASCCIASG